MKNVENEAAGEDDESTEGDRNTIKHQDNHL